ncbi:MAG TPA: hypothetical protein VER79_09090, partial [Candidatus Limnocylindrales bacterium]|nr:hypothetical protein [Candidatus Limnocylindrales bacterium]
MTLATAQTHHAQPGIAPNRWLRRAFRALMVLAIGLLALHLAVYTLYAANLIQFPFDYDQGEGFELVDTV